MKNNGDTYTQWKYMEYFYIPSGGKAFTVEGDPADYGIADPVFGACVLTEGTPVQASVSASWQNDAGTISTMCTGYTLYKETEPGVYAEWLSGDTSTATFQIPDVATKLVWHFDTEYLVSATVPGSSGTVSGSDWYDAGATATLTATPASGYRFFRWTGDLGDLDPESPTLSWTVNAPRAVSALFVPQGIATFDQYVSMAGSDENDGFSLQTAKATIHAAVAFLDLSTGSGNVYVDAGTYPFKYEGYITLTNAISIIGLTGDPADVVVTNTYGNAGANHDFATTGIVRDRHDFFVVDNAAAKVCNLSMDAGSVYQTSSTGASFTIGANGGMVSNCVIRPRAALNYYTPSAGGYLAAGVVTHCEFAGGEVQTKGGGNKGVALYLNGDTARVSNCYIHDIAEGKEAHAVSVLKGTLENCDVLRCKVNDTYRGVYAGANAGEIRNVVIGAIVSTDATDTDLLHSVPWGGTAGKFTHCATDGDTAINENCFCGTLASFFKNYAAGDLRPGDLLYGRGVNYEGMEATDLAGNPRLVCATIDIGCYESPAASTILLLR